MSAVAERRRARALAALMALAAAGAALTMAEGLLTHEEVVQEPPAISARAMADAVLSDTVEELVASYGGSQLPAVDFAAGAPDGPDAGTASADASAQAVRAVPPWLTEVAEGLESPNQILADKGGSLVSLCWRRDVGQADKLAQLLQAAGWQRVESGLEGCCSYVRMEGEDEWLVVSEWKGAEGVIVLVRCA